MALFKIIIVRKVTERVWIEIPEVETPQAAIAAYKEGEGTEVYHQFLATDSAQIEEVYQELSGGHHGPAGG
jgi:putative lipoic acid-binding regulatory protein